MKRIPIFIDDDTEQYLRQLATEEHESFNTLVSQALAEYLARRGITLTPRVTEPQVSISDPIVQARMLQALKNIHGSIQTDLTPDEIEDLITEVSEEMRQERMSSQLANRG